MKEGSPREALFYLIQQWNILQIMPERLFLYDASFLRT